MQAVIVLGDFAERDSVTGKVHILGAGWSVTGPAPTQQAVIVFVKIPADRARSPVPVVLRLVDSAGTVVAVPDTPETQPLEITGQIEMNEPEGWDDPADLDAVFVVNLLPIQLKPGTTYHWQVDVDGKEAASTAFKVRPEPSSEPLNAE